MLDVRGKLGQLRAVCRVDLINGEEQPCPVLREQAQELGAQPSPIDLAFGRQLPGPGEACYTQGGDSAAAGAPNPALPYEAAWSRRSFQRSRALRFRK